MVLVTTLPSQLTTAQIRWAGIKVRHDSLLAPATISKVDRAQGIASLVPAEAQKHSISFYILDNLPALWYDIVYKGMPFYNIEYSSLKECTHDQVCR
jgi:hypothetical protein